MDAPDRAEAELAVNGVGSVTANQVGQLGHVQDGIDAVVADDFLEREQQDAPDLVGEEVVVLARHGMHGPPEGAGPGAAYFFSMSSRMLYRSSSRTFFTP